MSDAVAALRRRLEVHRSQLENTAGVLQGLEQRVYDLEVKAGIRGQMDAAANPGMQPAFSPQAEVAIAWEEAHKMLGDPKARVPRDVFVSYWMSQLPEEAPKRQEFQEYLNELFETGTALMLPAQKNDLGKHCFGYASLLAGEFYFDQPSDRIALVSGGAADGLEPVRADLDADWANVPKDSAGRVTFDSFKRSMVAKHAALLTPETQSFYESFLAQDFRSALAMMLPEHKDTLGGHCFRYAALMAGEFYFDAAKDAVTGCGCTAPVADVLGVTK